MRIGKYAFMANRLKEILAKRDMILEDLSELTGISPGQLSRIQSGARGLSLENAVKIARALGIEIQEFTDEFDPEDLAVIPANFLDNMAKRRAKPDRDDPVIPNLTIPAGMGPGFALSVMLDEHGQVRDPEYTDGGWGLPDAVKAGFGRFGKLYSLPVRGDSMHPTLPGGSFVFVDTSHTFPDVDDIYAINDGDGLKIKRLKLVPKTDKILIISDNERYPTDEVHRSDVIVYGRVVASFQWRH